MGVQDGCILYSLTRSWIPERENRGSWHMILSRSKETALLDSSQARREGKHLKSMRLKQSLLRCSTKPSKYAKHESKSLSSRSFSLPIRPHASTFHPLKVPSQIPAALPIRLSGSHSLLGSRQDRNMADDRPNSALIQTHLDTYCLIG